MQEVLAGLSQGAADPNVPAPCPSNTPNSWSPPQCRSRLRVPCRGAEEPSCGFEHCCWPRSNPDFKAAAGSLLGCEVASGGLGQLCNLKQWG